MKQILLTRMRCPNTRQFLRLECAEYSGNEIDSGWLVSEDRAYKYPIRNGIPRFVPESNYADNFGMQWMRFSKTQLDSHSGRSISADRFWAATSWRPADMKDQWALDVGCGAGRFAEVALGAGAQVVALDYSCAVDACHANLRQHPNLHVVQGDIYALPFVPKSFTFVYSLGVLQHTPDVANAFFALPPMLAGGGHLCVDYYEKSIRSTLLPKYWLRPFTKRLPKEQLFSALEKLVPALLPATALVGRIPGIGRHLKRLIPVANYEGLLPLTPQQQIEWALLDTFDWLAPAYDNPQTPETVRAWLEKAGMESIEVLRAGHLVGRAIKR